MRYLDDMDVEDIAEAEGITKMAVWDMLYRTHAKFRTLRGIID
jgi:predicted DNA-binding protein YlxM (UPF0122 family)